MIIAIPDSLVIEHPEWCLAVAALSCSHGHTVVCVVERHREQAFSRLGRWAAYQGPDSWLDGAVWLERK